jgi:ATP-dependent DNA helicase RecG
MEWKRKWRDEFLKSLCGFANAQGGTLEVGREDDGTVTDVGNACTLLEELPNTIRQALGVVPSVTLREEDGKKFIAVSVDASSTPVSYHGRYYLRSGSTTQELTGSELDNFILRRLGKTWDGITIPKVDVADLDTSAFRTFRDKAIASERLQKSDLELSDEALLDSLSLVEDGELTRAAVLLFHHNPEKYVFGAFVKVGYFETGADLIYQDEFHGSLITVADEIVDTIYRKYFKGIISYEGILRVTDYPVPRPALREAIFNAIVHRDYTSGVPIQIKIYPDSVTIYNDGRLPENWTVADLLTKHRSRPFNPKIASTFFRAGFIETWGRGIERITTACKEAGKREPLFEAKPTEIAVTFFMDVKNATADHETDHDGFGEKFGDEFGDEFGDDSSQEKILALMRSNPSISAKSIGETIGMTTRGVEKSIKVLRDSGIIERIGAARGGHWEVKQPE